MTAQIDQLELKTALFFYVTLKTRILVQNCHPIKAHEK